MTLGSLDDMVILMDESPPGLAGSAPFLLNVGPPDHLRPVGFASIDIAESLLPRLNLGRRLWLEPAGPVMANFPEHFRSGKIVFFPTRQSISRFVNEPSFLPLRNITPPPVGGGS